LITLLHAFRAVTQVYADKGKRVGVPVTAGALVQDQGSELVSRGLLSFRVVRVISRTYDYLNNKDMYNKNHAKE
jgi:hypothetical protein